jgi:hypothetical protein
MVISLTNVPYNSFTVVVVNSTMLIFTVLTFGLIFHKTWLGHLLKKLYREGLNFWQYIIFYVLLIVLAFFTAMYTSAGWSVYFI